MARIGRARDRWGETRTQQRERPEVDLRSEDGIHSAYTAHGAELYRFALRQLHDEGAAQDVVQEVFLRAWRAAHSYDPSVASLRVWLFAIARNVVIDETRRRAVRPAAHDDDALANLLADNGTGVPDSFTESTLDSWLVEEALRKLSAEHRGALVETYLRGRKYAEVAAEMGVPVGTVRSRVFYGLKALRLALEEMGVQP